MAANIRLNSATNAELKRRKDQGGFKSVGAVIADLLGIGSEQEEAVADGSPRSSGASEEDAAPKKQRKINVMKELYSFKRVAKRKGMMKSITGFTEPQVELLIRRFREVIFFWHLTISRCCSIQFRRICCAIDRC